MKTLACSLGGVALALAGCSDVAPGAGSPADAVPAGLPAVVPIEQYAAVMARVECARFFACEPDNTRAQWRAVFGAYERCLAHDDELPGAPSAERQRRLVSMGLRRYDGAAARRCLDALRGSVCAAPAVCAEVFTGAVVEGGECRLPDQCAGDAYCAQRAPDGRYQCPGRCTARAAVGGQCLYGDSGMCSPRGAAGPVACQYDQTLRGTPNPYRCVVVTPTGAPVAAGEVCYDPAASGARQLPCVDGYDCRWVTTGDAGTTRVMRCQLPPVAGEICSGRCGDGSVCAFDQSVFQQRCQRVGIQGEGARCVQGNQGSESCDVLAGLDCVAGRCQRVGTGAEGSVCFSSRYGVDNCAKGLYCSAATLTCQRRKADGVPCRGADECQSRECVLAPGATQNTCGIASGCT